jgi:hypothetical protein
MRWGRRSVRVEETDQLGTPEQIALFVERQEALAAKAAREEAHQRVWHLKLDLVRRGMALIFAIALGIRLLVGG